MPPVAARVVKARAERLRAAGDAALIRHLDRQVGRPCQALVERQGWRGRRISPRSPSRGLRRSAGWRPIDLMGHDGRMAIARPPLTPIPKPS